MTDKTIINGVDVSGCENYVLRVRYDAFWDLNSKFHTCKHKTLCSDNTNCYFKQSFRKDERIKELEQDKRKNEYDIQLLELTHDSDVKKINYLEEKLSQIAELCDKVIVMDNDENIEWTLQALRTVEISKQIKQIAQGE